MTDNTHNTTVIAIVDNSITHTSKSATLNNNSVPFDNVYSDSSHISEFNKLIDSYTDGYNNNLIIYNTNQSIVNNIKLINSSIQLLYDKLQNITSRKQSNAHQYLITLKCCSIRTAIDKFSNITYDIDDLLLPSSYNKPIDMLNTTQNDSDVRIKQCSELVMNTQIELLTYIQQSIYIAIELNKRYYSVHSTDDNNNKSNQSRPTVIIDINLQNKTDDQTGLIRSSLYRICVCDSNDAVVIKSMNESAESIVDESLLAQLMKHNNAYHTHIYNVASDSSSVPTLVQSSYKLRAKVTLHRNALNYTINELRAEIKNIKTQMNLLGNNNINLKLVNRMKYLLNELNNIKQNTYESKKQKSIQLITQRNNILLDQGLLDCINMDNIDDTALQTLKQSNHTVLQQIIFKLNELDSSDTKSTGTLQAALKTLNDQYNNGLNQQITIENKYNTLNNTLSTDTAQQSIYMNRITQQTLHGKSDNEKINYLLERYTELQYRSKLEQQRYTEHMLILYKTYRMHHEQRISNIEHKYRELLHNSINDCMKINDQYTKLKIQTQQKQKLIS